MPTSITLSCASSANLLFAPRRIRLPVGGGGVDPRDWTVTQTLASVPYFVLGAAGELLAFARDALEKIPLISRRFRQSRGSYGGYRTVSSDEDAEVSNGAALAMSAVADNRCSSLACQILRDYDDEEL